MIPIGVGITFAAYTVGIWGYCLVRGYNVKFTQLFKATWPAAGPTPGQQFAAADAAAAQAAVQVGQRAAWRPTPSQVPTFPEQITGL